VREYKAVRCLSLPSRVTEQRMEYHDKVLKCVECGGEFVFTAGEQMFFADKGFKNEPKRCKACKAARVAGSDPGSTAIQRVETKTVCSQCGKETTVPFKPTQGRPVYCRECFQQRRTMAAPGATA
jgi:CxxC-x17-CxxC domain-containing protein